eukprot:975958-Rhodomonas_salina.1
MLTKLPFAGAMPPVVDSILGGSTLMHVIWGGAQSSASRPRRPSRYYKPTPESLAISGFCSTKCTRTAVAYLAPTSGLPEIEIHVCEVSSPTCLRACYAMSGTNMAYGAFHSVYARAAMSGTDVAYATLLSAYARAMQRPVLTSAICLRERYAIRA